MVVRKREMKLIRMCKKCMFVHVLDCKSVKKEGNVMKQQQQKTTTKILDQYGYTTPTRNQNVLQLYAISRNVGVTLDAHHKRG